MYKLYDRFKVLIGHFDRLGPAILFSLRRIGVVIHDLQACVIAVSIVDTCDALSDFCS